MSLFELHAQIEFPTHFILMCYPASQSLCFHYPKNGYGTPGECQNELYGHIAKNSSRKGLLDEDPNRRRRCAG